MSSVDVTKEGLVVTLSGPPPVLNGKTFLWVPYIEDKQLLWHCTGGTLEDKYRPTHCRRAS